MSAASREMYSVKTPERIIFGDPLYFEQFTGDELAKLIVDVHPPKDFVARLALDEYSLEDYPDELLRGITIYLAPKETIDVYTQDLMYQSQTCSNRNIGVDTARYYLQVDDRADTILTGADGYWGYYQELSREHGDNRIVDAITISINMPDDFSMADIREYSRFFFGEMEQIQCQSEAPLNNKKEEFDAKCHVNSTVKEFIKEFPDATLDLMTPGGYVYITPELGRSLLNGGTISPHLGSKDTHYEVPAEEILSQKIHFINQDKNDPACFHILTEAPDLCEDEAENQTLSM